MSDEKLLSIAYLDEGLIDSFQVIEMITRLEEKLKIKFSSHDLASEKFRTLKGVSEIIEKKSKGEK
jgi:acyl carrier protein